MSFLDCQLIYTFIDNLISIYVAYNSLRGENMICDTIKALRETAGFSQAELAKRLGVTRSSVNAWEMGLSVPTAQYVVEMAQLFRVSTDYLLGLNHNETIYIDGLTHEEKQILYSLINYFQSRQ